MPGGATVKIENLLARRNIQIENEEVFCGVQGCDQPSFRMSGECSKHLVKRVTGIYRLGIAQELFQDRVKVEYLWEVEG